MTKIQMCSLLFSLVALASLGLGSAACNSAPAPANSKMQALWESGAGVPAPITQEDAADGVEALIFANLEASNASGGNMAYGMLYYTTKPAGEGEIDVALFDFGDLDSVSFYTSSMIRETMALEHYLSTEPIVQVDAWTQNADNSGSHSSMKPSNGLQDRARVLYVVDADENGVSAGDVYTCGKEAEISTVRVAKVFDGSMWFVNALDASGNCLNVSNGECKLTIFFPADQAGCTSE